MEHPLLPLPAHRVRRGYLGGRELDRLAGLATPQDGSRPEDWIASTVPARNPGLPPIAQEGLAMVIDPATGQERLLRDLFVAHGAYYLGADHLTRLGPDLGFLAKLLDSSIRLHIQAHPTAAFARQHLNSRYGKLETYVVLAIRPDCPGYILLGFQRPPTPAEWRRIVLEQDLVAMHACFDRIPVRPGDVWLVPGGLPHAIGEGVLMLEVMEPSDLVVRCEFEREGIVVPPAARFMGRDPDFALQIFDFTPRSAAAVQSQCRTAPQPVARGSGFAAVEQLIGPTQTNCFSITRLTVAPGQPAELPATGRVAVALVAGGAGTVHTADSPRLTGVFGQKFLVAAGAGLTHWQATGTEPWTVLWIEPGA